MRRSLAKFSESEASDHTPSWADFITTMPELKLSVRTGVRHRRLNPAPSIDLIKQHLDWIIGRDGDLHRLPRSSISTVEQLTNCSNPRGLVFALSASRKTRLGAVSGIAVRSCSLRNRAASCRASLRPLSLIIEPAHSVYVVVK